METIFTILLITIVGILIWLIFEIRRSRNSKEESKDEKSIQILSQQINDLNRSVDEKVGSSQKEMREAIQGQFSESQKLISNINKEVSKHLINVTREISETKESNKQVFSMTKQLQDLEKVLKNQKTRGNLGEMGLELVLSNMLSPADFKMQYSFTDGKIVDAVIKTPDGLIPIDAKFSLDNYRRLLDEDDENRKEELKKQFNKDLKKRIDETAKYIKPNENTLSFAFMFIPAEGIYYDLLVNEVGALKTNARNMIDYAYNDKKVIIVSPTTFSAYLHSVLYGFKALKIEKQAEGIIKNVSLLGKHLKAYEEFTLKIGSTLSTTVNHYNKANRELGKIEKDITKITGKSPDLESLFLDKPEEE